MTIDDAITDIRSVIDRINTAWIDGRRTLSSRASLHASTQTP
jgi:hypothetical protein